MLKRLYVHNYKCLVNFEINFDQDISLFLGANGSGKTSLMAALYEVQRFVHFNSRLDDTRYEINKPVFETSSLTRWLNEDTQKFEIDVEGNDGVYSYILEIEHRRDRNFARVKTETLTFSNQTLFKFWLEEEGGKQAGKGELFHDDPARKGAFYPSDGFSSGLGSVQERHDNTKLTWFKKWLQRLYIARINPGTIEIEIGREEQHPELNLSNYAAWMNYWNNENREGVSNVEQQLRETVPGFKTFKFTQSGLKKILEVKIDKDIYRFDELSDGQKALAILYTMIFCVPENSVICIDEPENFLALPEIQPWLNELEEQCKQRNLQALLISHHPSVINLLAPSLGYWFSRQDNHSRIEKITEQEKNGLSLAQLIEIGWIYGD